jgi:hypothetical protein
VQGLLRHRAFFLGFIYGLVSYEGVQGRLLQELIDNDINESTQWTADIIVKLPFIENFIKVIQRRHSPAFQPDRAVGVDLVLPEGYKIPKDSGVISFIHHIHIIATCGTFPPNSTLYLGIQTKLRTVTRPCIYLFFAGKPTSM